MKSDLVVRLRLLQSKSSSQIKVRAFPRTHNSWGTPNPYCQALSDGADVNPQVRKRRFLWGLGDHLAPLQFEPQSDANEADILVEPLGARFQ